MCWKKASTNHLLWPRANRSSIETGQQWSNELQYEKCHVYGWRHFFSVTHSFCYFSHNFWPWDEQTVTQTCAEKDRLISREAPQHEDIYTFATCSMTLPNLKKTPLLHPSRSQWVMDRNNMTFLPAEPGAEMKGKYLPFSLFFSCGYIPVYALFLSLSR